MSSIHIKPEAFKTYHSTGPTDGSNWIARDPDGSVAFDKTPAKAANFWSVAQAFYGLPASDLMASPKLRREAQRWGTGEGAYFYAVVDDLSDVKSTPVKKAPLVAPTPKPSAPASSPALMKVSAKSIAAPTNHKVAEVATELHGKYVASRAALLARYESSKAAGDVTTANRYAKQIKHLDDAALRLAHAPNSAVGEYGIYSMEQCTALREAIYTAKRCLGESRSDAARAVSYMPGVPLLDEQMHLMES